MNPGWLMSRLLPTLMLSGLLFDASTAVAQPSEYAVQWPVSAKEEGAFALQLDESVYRQLSRSDLSDLAAFNADGQELPFGSMPATYSTPLPSWREARWFPLPASSDASAGVSDDLHLQIRRAANGELSLDASVDGRPAAANAGIVHALLVDVRAGQQTVEAIEFEPGAEAGDFNIQVSVEASEDLEQWQTVVASATLAQMHQGGHTLARKQIEFAPIQASYLRVRSLAGQALAVQSLRLQLRPRGLQHQSPPRQWFTADFVAQEGTDFIYRLPVRVSVEQIAVGLADDNTVAEISVSARDDTKLPWQYVGGLNAFRLRGAGLALDNAAMPVAGQRSRYWRISTASGSDLRKAPQLRFAWRPESWLLLTHGRAPYVIAAGSQRAARQDFPLEMLVGQVRSKYGNDWQPATASLGMMQQAGGDAALRAYDPEKKRTWLLWGILLLGALAVVVMVLKLLKTPPRE